MLALLSLAMAASLQCQAGFPDGPDGFRGPALVRKAQPDYTKEAIAAYATVEIQFQLPES